MSNNIVKALVNGIVNNDQSPFNNTNFKAVSHLTTLPIAVLSNIEKTTILDEADVIIDLTPINLTFEEFVILFYKNSGHNFEVSASNADCLAVSFLNQKYNTTTNKTSIFSLYDQFRKAWAKKNSKGESMLTFVQLIELQRDTFLMKNLNSLGIYTIGLSLDEVLQNLITTGNIKPTNCLHVNEYNQGVPVEFIIQARVFSPALNITLQVNFHYIVKIPGFIKGDVVLETIQKNCQNNTPHNNFKAREFFDDGGDDFTLPSVCSENKMGKHEYDFDNTKKHAELEKDEDRTVFSEVSKIINNYGDKNVMNGTVVDSVDSSKW